MSFPPRYDPPRDSAALEPIDTTSVPRMSLPSPQRPSQEAPPAPASPSLAARTYQRLRDYFLAFQPTLWSALGPLALLSIVLFTRSPATNYIFDEQEALLANPYVNATGGLRFIDAIHRDFWGLPPDRSVGSYRPLPNLLWRALWSVSKQPFLHHFYNVLFHALNGAILTWIALRLTRRRGVAYLAGFIFVACAVLTEAVSGIVGIADVLGGMGALAALAALALPAWQMPFACFAGVLFGLFSKESALVCVPLIPVAALVSAPLMHPERPARVLRALLALLGSAAAFVLYVELRRRWFPSPTPAELTTPLPPNATELQRALRAALLWFHQAPLPRDPLNNPLGDADTPHRIAGALRVYWRGLTQIVFPRTLSGDYSYPQEPIPDQLVFFGSVAGAALTVLPLLGAVVLWIAALFRERAERLAAFRAGSGKIPPRRWWLIGIGTLLVEAALGLAVYDWMVLRPENRLALMRALPLVLWPLPFLPLFCVGLGLIVQGTRPRPIPASAELPSTTPIGRGFAGMCTAAIGMVWIVVSYFPHSNIPVVLPTVRAERFWYFPAIGSSLLLAVVFSWLHGLASPPRRFAGEPRPLTAFLVPALFAGFFGFQCVQAYRHAMDYRSDLDFWAATKLAVPNSAKAHLNYSVMKGARGDLETRLVESRIAVKLAPSWAMAHVYTGDTLCRMHRAEEAWPHYKRGFELGPNELSLIALALQCLYDEKRLQNHGAELKAMAEAHPGSWLAYLGPDTLENSEAYSGVDPKYRPRGYNEGPKE